jgi:hypothetical protein
MFKNNTVRIAGRADRRREKRANGHRKTFELCLRLKMSDATPRDRLTAATKTNSARRSVHAANNVCKLRGKNYLI